MLCPCTLGRRTAQLVSYDRFAGEEVTGILSTQDRQKVRQDLRQNLQNAYDLVFFSTEQKGVGLKPDQQLETYALSSQQSTEESLQVAHLPALLATCRFPWPACSSSGLKVQVKAPFQAL